MTFPCVDLERAAVSQAIALDYPPPLLIEKMNLTPLFQNSTLTPVFMVRDSPTDRLTT
jgi:hypothetical protein